MATVIEIDDDLARETQAVADRDGLPIARYVEAVLARALAERHRLAATARPVVVPTFQGGGGLVDGLTLEQAIERADLEYDLKKIGRAGADADAPV